MQFNSNHTSILPICRETDRKSKKQPYTLQDIMELNSSIGYWQYLKHEITNNPERTDNTKSN